MAGSIRAFLKYNLTLTNNLLRGSTFVNGRRSLYSESMLGIPNYEKIRLLYRTQFMNIEDKFKDKMRQVVQNEASMVFTEDLKTMLYLMQNNESDLDLIQKMISKFNEQNKELRFGTFIFGPVVMRTFYYLNEADTAVTLFQDPEKTEFFNQFTSAKILLTLLYKNCRYEDMKSVYETVQNKQIQGVIHPRDAFTLMIAGCYRENTKEALDYALNIWRDMTAKGTRPPMRCILNLAALAIEQCAPSIALEILSAVNDIGHAASTSLKISAYADLNNFSEIARIIRTMLNQHQQGQLSQHQQGSSISNIRNIGFFTEVLEKVQMSLHRENESSDSELFVLLKELHNSPYVIDMTVNKYISQPIQMTNSKVLVSKRHNYGQMENQRRYPRSGYPLRKEFTNQS